MPSNYHHTVIKQQHGPPPKVKDASDIFLIPGDDEMVQNITPINKSGPQDIFSLWIKEDDFKYVQKKS